MEFVKRQGISIIAIITAIVAVLMSGKGGMHALGYEDEQSSSTAAQTITYAAPGGVNCRVLVVDQSTGGAAGAPVGGGGTPGIAQPGANYSVPANTSYRLFPQFLDVETNTWKPFELKSGGTPASSVFVGSFVDRGGAPHGITITVTVQ